MEINSFTFEGVRYNLSNGKTTTEWRKKGAAVLLPDGRLIIAVTWRETTLPQLSLAEVVESSGNRPVFGCTAA